ncbi:hypothetical protein BLOT_011724 [Blomia tropicalis]|nr:hypothetical protein BLOT_011724 [Blomia tropicalis]
MFASVARERRAGHQIEEIYDRSDGIFGSSAMNCHRFNCNIRTYTKELITSPLDITNENVQ